jgi:malonyl CoA-acyl carrier protein transacylase
MLEIGADIGVKLQALTGGVEQLANVRRVLTTRDDVQLIDPGMSIPYHSRIFRRFEAEIMQRFGAIHRNDSDNDIDRCEWWSR